MVSLGKQLHAQSNCLRADGAKAISEMLKVNKTLTMVDLSDNEIGAYAKNNDGRAPWIPSPEGPAALADGLKANSTVQQLHAQNNGLGPEGAKSFGSMLEHNNTLTLLDVSGNNMGAEGAASLAEGLKANTGVQQLDASSNSLGPEGAKALAASIAENSTITSVRTLLNSFRIISAHTSSLSLRSLFTPG